MPRVFKNTMPTEEIRKTASHSKPGVRRDIAENNPPLPDPNEPEFAKYAVDQVGGSHGKGNQVKCKI